MIRVAEKLGAAIDKRIRESSLIHSEIFNRERFEILIGEFYELMFIF